MKWVWALLFAIISHGVLATEAQIVAGFRPGFEQSLRQEGVPGGAYVIVKEDRILAMHTHGTLVLGGQEAITPDTVFRLASVSKTFAAELTLLMAKQGKLTLADKVIDYLPEFAFRSSSASLALSIEHLLSHSSGIVPNAYDNMLEADHSIARILPHFKKLTPMCTPGQCYTYQNVLFSLIDPILHKVTGQGYGELLKREVFTPLDMSRASVGRPAFLSDKNRARPHVRRKTGFVQGRVDKEFYGALPAAGINASISDMAKWLMAHTSNAHPALSAIRHQTAQPKVKTRRELYRKHWREHLSSARYGLGWRIYKMYQQTLIYHSGWVSGYRAEIAYSPEHKLGLAVLINAESKELSRLTSEFWSSLLSHKQALAQVPTSLSATLD